MTARSGLWMFAFIITCATPAVADQMAACHQNANPDARLSACTDIIKQQPDNATLADAWTYRGQAYLRKGMTTEATNDFTRAIGVDKKHAAAWSGRGTAYLTANKLDYAIGDFSTAINLKPDDASSYVSRGYALLIKGDPKSAIRDFSKSLEFNPTIAPALNNRGLAYRKLGQYKRAIADYTKAIQAKPLYALAYNNRGYAYEALGKKAKAISDLRRALTIDPSLTGARDALVRLSAAEDIASLSSQRVAAGREIVQKSCAWCHATGAKGDSPNTDAPRFRDIHSRHPILSLRKPISRAIATPHNKMPKLPLTRDQVDQVIAYINSLKP